MEELGIWGIVHTLSSLYSGWQARELTNSPEGQKHGRWVNAHTTGHVTVCEWDFDLFWFDAKLFSMCSKLISRRRVLTFQPHFSDKLVSLWNWLQWLFMVIINIWKFKKKDKIILDVAEVFFSFLKTYDKRVSRRTFCTWKINWISQCVKKGRKHLLQDVVYRLHPPTAS